MPRFITVADVRRSSGADVTLMNDANVEAAIDIVEAEVERFLNSKFTPTEKIEILDGNGKNTIVVDKNPLLKIKELIINDVSISLDAIRIYKESGIIGLKNNAETSIFTFLPQTVIIKYLYAWLEETTTITNSTADISAGTSVEIDVIDETGFVVNNWVEIYGTDGYREVAKITATAADKITVDELSTAHASGSTIVKVEIPYYVKRFMELEASLYVLASAISTTYKIATNYSAPEYSIAKGVPYVHFNNSFDRLQKERDRILAIIKPRISIR